MLTSGNISLLAHHTDSKEAMLQVGEFADSGHTVFGVGNDEKEEQGLGAPS
jgi:hypothetical protein